MDCRFAVKELEEKKKVDEEDVLKLRGCERELLEELLYGDAAGGKNCKVRKKLLYALCRLFELYGDNLSELKDPLRNVLIGELRGKCPWSKGVAAEFSGKLGIEDPEVVELVVKALGDSCPWVRHRAADALSRFCRNPEFARQSYRALIERLEKDSSPYVQNYAFHALKVCLETFFSCKMEKEAEETKKAMEKIIPLS